MTVPAKQTGSSRDAIWYAEQCDITSVVITNTFVIYNPSVISSRNTINKIYERMTHVRKDIRKLEPKSFPAGSSEVMPFLLFIAQKHGYKTMSGNGRYNSNDRPG